MAFTWNSVENAKEAAALAVQSLLQEHVEEPVLFLSSSGSWFEVLDMVEIPPMQNITLSMLDERFSEDPAVNNFAQLTNTTFYKTLKEAGALEIDTRIRNGESHNHHAGRMQTEMRAWGMLYEQGVVIATMGVGVDGHTAGIIPEVFGEEEFCKTFDDPEHLMVAYDASPSGNPYPLRTTASFPFLRSHIDYAILYATGDEKCAVLHKVKEDEGNLSETPSRIMREMPSVDVYTDCK